MLRGSNGCIRIFLGRLWLGRLRKACAQWYSNWIRRSFVLAVSVPVVGSRLRVYS